MIKTIKYLVPLSIILFLTTSLNAQTKGKKATTDSTNKITSGTSIGITDSTNIFSIKDLNEFTKWLQNSITVGYYKSLTPEATIQLFWDWKQKQRK